MARAVLITQCLQVDFVAPVGAHDPLPNWLHVGHAEALRLLGPDPEAGPVAQVLRWARADTDLDVLHVRDWHDRADLRQRDHLDAFGDHCIRGSDGARLVLGWDRDMAPHERTVDSVALNDFEGTTLLSELEGLRRRPTRRTTTGPLRAASC